MVSQFRLTGNGRTYTGIALGLILLLLLAGCTSDTGQKELSQGEGSSEVVELTFVVMEARRFEFAPSWAEVRVGQKVKLTLDNTGRAEHDLQIVGIPAELEGIQKPKGHQHGAGDIVVHALPGTQGSIIFTPTSPGKYVLLCTLPGHKEAGMVGEIVVLV